MINTTDVAIVGGGVIGTSIAYYLSKHGIRSTLFEQWRFASGASGATAGIVAPVRYISTGSPETFSLGLKSLRMFPQLADELKDEGIDPEFQQNGYLKVALTEDQAVMLREELAWQDELDLGVRWLSLQQIIEREPEINRKAIGATFSPLEGSVSGQRLVTALVQAATRRGAQCFDGTEVVGLEIEKRQVLGVRTSTGTVQAGHTILAAGPWTGLIDRWIPGLNLPIRPVKGQRILVRKSGILPRCPVNSFVGSIVPQRDGNLLVGASREEGKFDQEITTDAIKQILANAESIFPSLKDARFVSAMAGVRPGSPDDIPIIGPIPDWDRLSVASGHDWMGIMLSPGTGDLMANYIDKGDDGPLRPFSISRFTD